MSQEANLVLADVIRAASRWTGPGSERKVSCSLLLLERGDATALQRLQSWADANGARLVVNEARRKDREHAERSATVDVIITGKPLDLAGAVRKARA